MNPILDIFAVAKTNALPTPGGTGISGQPSGDSQFAQLFADAVGATPQLAALPFAGLPVMGKTEAAEAVLPDAVEGLPASSHEAQVINEIFGQVLTEVPAKNATGGEVQVLSQQQIESAMSDEAVPATLDEMVPVSVGAATQPLSIGAIMARVPSMELLSQLIATETLRDQQSQLTSHVGAELTSLTGEEANGVVINAQVELSDEAAKAIAGSDNDGASKASATEKYEGSILDSKQTGKAIAVESHSLKSHLRKAFPSLNIESASGKVNVQVILTNAGTEARTRIDLPISNQKIAATNGLPIAVAPQIATAVQTSGRPTKSTRVTRQPQSVGNAPVQSPARTVIEGEAPIRLENRIAIRKPVQVALKSQGFDIEKLMSSESRVKDPLAENIAIDKTDFKVAADKQIQQATDRSLELNGTERFKLDIKRGHIEALLKKGEIKLQLQPEHLGHLKIKLTTTPTEVSARMETSSEDAKRAVELSLPQLRESFERAGLKLNSIEVLVNDDSDSRRQHAFQHEWRGRNGRSNASADRFVVDVPAVAEISQNPNTVYGGALNLVA